MPKVSVIIPTCNCVEFLQEAINSVLSQRYQDFEIIVIDDGSSDNTKEVVGEYINRNFNKIRYFYQKNKGPSAARNKGIKESKGEYIAFLDADDIWSYNKIEKQIRVLENNLDVGFVYCDNFFVDEERKTIPNYGGKIKLVHGDITIELFCNRFIFVQAVVLRKKCLEKVGLFNEKLLVGEDYDFLLRLACFFKTEVIKEKLWERRVLKNSLSRKDFIMDAKNDLNTFVNFLNCNPDFFQKYKDRILYRLSNYYFSFAYNCLENGRNILAFRNLIHSIQYKPSLKAFKNILLCLFPYKFRKFLKNQMKDRGKKKKYA